MFYACFCAILQGIAGSSNGRTHPSGGCYLGSSPSPAASIDKVRKAWYSEFIQNVKYAKQKMENMDQQFGQLFQTLATGSIVEVKEAKKKIEKLWHDNNRKFENSEVLVLETIKNIDNIKDGAHKVAVISGLNLFILALEDKYFDQFSDFVLKCMEDKDGRVREAARHIASWLRIKNTLSERALDDDKGKNVTKERKKQAEQDTKLYEQFIDKIEILMKKHAPTDKPFYIGGYPSSIYKSLVHLWHDMSYGTSRDYDHREYLMDCTNEYHIPFLGYDDYEEEIDPDEIEGNIWADKSDGDPIEGGKWLEKLEEIAIKRFDNELIRLKFDKGEIGKIMSALRFYGMEATTNILKDIMLKGRER